MGTSRDEISTTGTVRTFFFSDGACSGTLFHVLDRAFDGPRRREERAAMPLAGGIVQHGHQCGMTWGAALAAGARALRLLGAGPEAEARAIVAARRLVDAFRAQNGHVDCYDLCGLDETSSNLALTVHFVLKGGTVRCARRAARYAPAAREAIDATMSEPVDRPPAGAVSCAAALVREAGLADEDAVIAAGLAGGIGLSGRACGALGAAVWAVSLRTLDAGAEKLEYKAPRALRLIDRFRDCTGGEFECARIVGRRFEDVADHAAYLRGGGCAELVRALAAEVSAPR